MHRGRGRRDDSHRGRLGRLRRRGARERHGSRGRRRLPPLRQLRHLRQQVLHRLRPLRRVLGKHPGQQHIELVGQGGVQLGGGRDRSVDGGVSHLHSVGADERQAAGEHLKGEDAHRVDVAPAIDLMTHNLLRRHVPRRADRQSDGGQVRRLPGAASQPEVGEHGAAVGVDEHVGGLEVAMHDPRVMSVLQAIPDLAQVAPRCERVERTAVEDVAERAAADQRHGQEGHTLGDLEVVDRQDVRVVELGERLRLRFEPLDESLVLEKLWRQRLERHLAAEGLLDRAIDDGHAAAAEALDDLVLADSCAG